MGADVVLTVLLVATVFLMGQAPSAQTTLEAALTFDDANGRVLSSTH